MNRIKSLLIMSIISMALMLGPIGTIHATIVNKQTASVQTVVDEYQFENAQVIISGRCWQIGYAPGVWDPFNEELYIGPLDMIFVNAGSESLENLSIKVVDNLTGVTLFNKNRISGTIQAEDVDGIFYWGLIGGGNDNQWPPIIYVNCYATGDITIKVNKINSFSQEIVNIQSQELSSR